MQGGEFSAPGRYFYIHSSDKVMTSLFKNLCCHWPFGFLGFLASSRPFGKISASFVLQKSPFPSGPFIISVVRACFLSRFDIDLQYCLLVPVFVCPGITALVVNFTHLSSGYLSICPQYLSLLSSMSLEMRDTRNSFNTHTTHSSRCVILLNEFGDA